MNHRHLHRLAAILLLGSLHAGASLACSIRPDHRSAQQRIDDSPLAFIGTVLSVDEARVNFRIETPIRGITGPTYSAPLTLNTCGRVFSTGQRWLFTGTSVVNPGFVITSSRQAPPKAPDQQILSNSLLSCKAQSDCSIVHYGCDGSQAVASSSLLAAQKQLHGAFGNPQTLNCAASTSERYASPALCIDNMCRQAILYP